MATPPPPAFPPPPPPPTPPPAQGGGPPPPPPGGPALPPPPYTTYGYAAPRTEGMAIAALVVGIVAVAGLFCYGVPALIAGPVAIVLGLVADRRIKASGGAVGGHGLAMAGWIIGICATVLGALAALVVFGMMAFMIAAIQSGTFPSPTTYPFPTPTG